MTTPRYPKQPNQVSFSNKLQLRVNRVGFGNPNEGLVYEVAMGSEHICSITPTGLVTPKSPGQALIIVKLAESGAFYKRVIVIVQSDAQAKFESDVNAGARQVQVAVGRIIGGNDKTPPLAGNANFIYNTEDNTIEANWDQGHDPEIPDSMLRVFLDIRSEDGLSVVKDEEEITNGGALPPFTLPTDGKAYVITIITENMAGLRSYRTFTTPPTPEFLGYGESEYGEDPYGDQPLLIVGFGYSEYGTDPYGDPL